MKSQRSHSTRAFYSAIFAACLNGLSVGNLAGWSQAAIPQLLSSVSGSVRFGESEVSWIVGIFFLGMLGGGFASLSMAERFGKRRLFLLASLPLLLGWSVVAVATTFWEFVFGRVVLGLGGGMLCHQTEMYLSEVSPTRLRSSTSILFCVSIHMGVLLSFGIGPSLSISSATSVYLAVVILLAGFYLCAAPETPFWLVRRGRADEALEVLRSLRGRPDVAKELREIVEFVEGSEQLATSKELGCCTALGRVLGTRAKRRAILLVVLLTTAQQFSGMAAMHSYAQLIFERFSGPVQGRYVSLLIGSIELCCTMSSGFIVERVGRRCLVGASTLVCSICMGLMGLHFHGLLSNNSALPIVLVVVFALSYGLGLAILATVIAAECLSMDARNIGAAAQNTTVCFSIFIVTKLWQMVASTYGQEYSFWIAAIITAIHAAVLLSILPETRGKSLVEIQTLLVSSSCIDMSPRAIIPLLPVFRSIKIVSASQKSAEFA